MSRIVTPALESIINGPFVRASTLELRLTDGTLLYWATLPLSYGGHDYQGGWLAQVDGMEQSVSTGIDRATVRLHNADERFSRLVVDARRLFEHATGIIGAAFARKDDYDRHASRAAWVWQERFRGRVRLPSGELPQAKLELVSDREAAGLLVSDSYAAGCELAYKSAECGYAGDLVSCDKTLKGSNGCERHANAHRYPGAVGEPETVAAPPGSNGDGDGGIGSGGGFGGGDRTCFPAGTAIWLPDGTTAPIETLRVGDKVRCFNEDARAITVGTVTQTHRHEGVSEFVEIELLDPSEPKIYVTPEHPFLTWQGWQPAGEIVRGSKFVTYQGRWGVAPVHRVRRVQRASQTVYNLSVAPHPTYLVGLGVVVHNLKDWDIIGGIVL